MLFSRWAVFVQCFDGDGCCGDDCRVGVVVLLVVVMLMVVVWKLVFMLVVAVVIMVVVAGGCCAMSTWKKPLAAASVSLSQFLARPRLVESSHFLFLSLRHLRS